MPEPVVQYGAIDRQHGTVAPATADSIGTDTAYRWSGPAGDVGPWLDLHTHQPVTLTQEAP